MYIPPTLYAEATSVVHTAARGSAAYTCVSLGFGCFFSLGELYIIFIIVIYMASVLLVVYLSRFVIYNYTYISAINSGDNRRIIFSVAYNSKSVYSIKPLISLSRDILPRYFFTSVTAHCKNGFSPLIINIRSLSVR